MDKMNSFDGNKSNTKVNLYMNVIDVDGAHKELSVICSMDVCGRKMLTFFGDLRDIKSFKLFITGKTTIFNEYLRTTVTQNLDIKEETLLEDPIESEVLVNFLIQNYNL